MRKKIIISLLMLFPLISNSAPFVYVANHSTNAVDVIDVATNSLFTSVALPHLPGTVAAPHCIAIAPDGKTIAVGNSNFLSTSATNATTIVILDITSPTPTIINTFPAAGIAGVSPIDLAYTTDSNSIYVTCDDHNIYSGTITGSTLTIAETGTIPQPAPIAIGTTPNGQTAYIGNIGNAGTHNVYAMSIPSNTLTPILVGGFYTEIHALAISPDGKTVYAVSTDTQLGPQLFTISTTSNTLNSTNNLPSGSDPVGIVVSPDGNHLYIADNGNNDFIVIPTNNLSSMTTFSSANPVALAITPNSSQLYVVSTTGNASPYLVPAGTSGSSIVLGGNSITQFSIVATPPALSLSPASVSGCKTKNVFLLQTDYINNITWTAPTSGSPAAYAIYRDSALTQLAAIVPASGPLQYYDHDRNPNVTYTYYIVSVDASGGQSAPASVTVTQNC